MNQDQALSKIEESSKTMSRNLWGIFILIFGVLLLMSGPALYFESMSDTVSPMYKTGIGGIVTGLVGAGIAWLGWSMLLSRRKLSAQDLSGSVKARYFVGVTHGGKVVSSPQLMEVQVSPQGINLLPHHDSKASHLAIKWSDVVKTQWRSLYSRDSYQINYGDYCVVFAVTDPMQLRTEHRGTVLASLFGGQLAGSAAQLAIEVENMKDIGKLSLIHAYSKVYMPQATTKWSNYSPEQFWFGFIPVAAALVVLTFWTLGLAKGLGLGNQENIIGIVAVVVGFFWFFYRINLELKFSQKITGTKNF